ncbi:MAG: DUF2635 domain-containing protein [Magnetospirillum sp.]|nr:DUF2635 domain-containing protein [Magnetospirillum sp.]
MYVKPAPGLKIRDPDLRDLLPEGGREVPKTPYWIRRVRDGDVVVAAPAQSNATGAPSAIADGATK